MATTHVFIVDTNTFKYHLEYLFAGTGAKDYYIDFNQSAYSKLRAENNLVGMTADSQRIRKGDYIIFYLQQNSSDGVTEGKFYGIFKAKHSLSFLDNNDSQQFLKDKLKKSLTFRVLIEPYEVYSNGVTEWEALDEIKNIQSPNQMLWSLIYRKLKGNRGNTMITIYESERLFDLIRRKNNLQILEGQNFTFDKTTQLIAQTNSKERYSGRQVKINILPRLIQKYNQELAFEPHLQTYIVQNIGKNINNTLDENIIPSGMVLEWIGNEVSCGVGMQRIDVLISTVNRDGGHRILIPIELKAVEAEPSITRQIQRYVDWIEQYYLSNRPSTVQPIIIAKHSSYSNQGLIAALQSYNKRNGNKYLKLKYIDYVVRNNSLAFRNIQY